MKDMTHYKKNFKKETASQNVLPQVLTLSGKRKKKCSILNKAT